MIVAALAGQAACVPFAQPARLEQMTAASRPDAQFLPPSLESGIGLGTVSGGESTNPMWTSEVGNAEFRSALEASLRNYRMLAANGLDSYRLDADLVGVEQPMMGFDITVTSTVNYKVTQLPGGEIVLSTTVVAPYTATTGDAFVGVERLRLANEGSIRENIAEFLRQLIEAVAARPPVA